ncbi:MAG: response regulator [Planctomycetales bacterium]|nr:response regulator [Planctomycetales bacterium]
MAASPALDGPPCVVVLDPDEGARARTCAALAGRALRVIEASDEHEAVHVVRWSRRPVVVVFAACDCRSLEVVERIREAGARVVLLSPGADWDLYFRAVEAGAEDVLPKPADPTALVWAVEGAVAAARSRAGAEEEACSSATG